MIVKIYPQNPNEKAVAQVVECLRSDGVVIYPTDSVYAYGCSIRSPKAIEKIKTIRTKTDKELTIVCGDISSMSEYVKFDNSTFKLLKRNLPGAFTFILPASSKVPDKALDKRKNIGIRIPDNSITQAIVEALGCPMITSSVKDFDDEHEYTTDPELIHEKYGMIVDLVVDGGYGEVVPTTVVDLTEGDPTIVRQGRGELE